MTRRLTGGPAIPVALALLAFVPALWGSFVADDYSMLHTVDGLDGPLSAFARNDRGESGGGHFYRPLWVLLNLALFERFGEEPAAFHVVNVLLFAAVTFQVWWLLRRLTAPVPAVVGAAAFAVYPRHAESVAWVSGTTDLLAGVFVLGALMALLSRRSAGWRLSVAATLTVLGALSKEIAFVTPALAFAVLAVGPADRRDLRMKAPLVLAAVLVPLAVLRFVVIDGIGGNTENAVGPLRIAGSAGSYALGALAPHELEVLRRPYLLLIPLALVVAGAVVVRRLDPDRRRLAVAGLAMFAIALVPVVAEPMDLNNASGERLLLIPSVGLALVVATLVRVRVAVALAPLLLGLSLLAAFNWERAGSLADQTVSDVASLVPPGTGITLLSTPDGYRNAHVFPNSLDLAVRRQRPRTGAVSVCAPVLVTSVDSGSIRFGPRGPGAYRGQARDKARFDFPVLGSEALSRAGCEVVRVPGAKESIGLDRAADVIPAPGLPIAFFDGARVHALPSR